MITVADEQPASNIVPVNMLSIEPYASVLSYPKATVAELKKRILELKSLHVSALEFSGGKMIGNVRVLGKGNVGIVVVAFMGNREIALKIRRIDADRKTMRREARMLAKANSAHVGPELVAVGKNFLSMQFIRGYYLPEWVTKTSSQARSRKVFLNILEQCHRLDSVELDHGELSMAAKHVLIDAHDVPFIIDFESASINRRPSNVTSMCQYLFLRRQAFIATGWDKQRLMQALKRYKKKRTFRNFKNVLKQCGLLNDVIS